LGAKSPLATIVTSYDRTSFIPFASAAADLLIKPFNVEQFENAMGIARAKIAAAKAKFGGVSEYSTAKIARWISTNS
jgi:DNA-binding LytR/AlgR family response regulator